MSVTSTLKEIKMKVYLGSSIYALGIVQDCASEIEYQKCVCLKRRYTPQEFEDEVFNLICMKHDVLPEHMKSYLSGNYYLDKADLLHYLTILGLYKTKTEDWETLLKTLDRNYLSMISADDLYHWLIESKRLFERDLTCSQVLKRFQKEIFEY